MMLNNIETCPTALRNILFFKFKNESLNYKNYQSTEPCNKKIINNYYNL